MRKWINLMENASGEIEVEFVCVHGYNAPKNTPKEAAARLWKKLKTIPNLCIYKQDFVEEANHKAMCAIIVEDDDHTLEQVKKAAKACGVEIDIIARNHHLYDIQRGIMGNLTAVVYTNDLVNLAESAENADNAGPVSNY